MSCVCSVCRDRQRGTRSRHSRRLVPQVSGVWQSRVSSPTLVTFLEIVTADALDDHCGRVSTGGQTVTKPHIVDGIDRLAGKEDTRQPSKRPGSCVLLA
ncbi:hypothetical protein ACOMHN_024909 [Nucella lapillus]